jgi:ribosomal protein S18 acetylase RimI-like enzyme
MPVIPANINDIPLLVLLINSAYRGEMSKKGWTTEADLLAGDLRTDIATLTELLNKPQTKILKYSTNDGIIAGCVFLEKQERGLYLGMLSVSPILQSAGIGKQLMKAAEAYAHENNCSCIYLHVISVRYELINWYKKQGYQLTGEVRPFVDSTFGIAKQPIEFNVLQKILPVKI